jgi:hypothetical protein
VNHDFAPLLFAVVPAPKRLALILRGCAMPMTVGDPKYD